MASDQTGTQTFNVTYQAPIDEEPVPAGVVAVGSGLQLDLVSAEPEFEDRLELAVDMLNGSPRFLVHADPPPGEATRAVHKRAIERDAPDARDALFTVLREKYGFELTAAG